MRRTGQAIIAALSLVAVTISTTGVAGASQQHPLIATQMKGSGPPLKAAVPGPHSARYAVAPFGATKNKPLVGADLEGTTVPSTLYSVTAGQDGNSYNFYVVGGNVTSGSSTTNITTLVIPVVVTFAATGDSYDPRSQNSSCGETQSALSGTLNGPIFKKRPWNEGRTAVGSTQYTDAQIREELWTYTNPHGSSPNYHVFLNASSPGAFGASIPSSLGAEINTGTCNALGEVDFNAWDSFVQGTLIPDAVSDFGLTSSMLPVFLLKNVVLTQNSGSSCCILGYHNAFNTNGNTQTYSTSDYVTDGEFGSTQDLAPTSHEIAEWANDPFVTVTGPGGEGNPTPSWGHIGQVSGCQSNLEVGDPLSGTVVTILPTRPGGQTYHVQELAFLGWFYDSNLGVNGVYSTKGTFTSGATLCS